MLKILKSRTVWTFLVLFIINGLEGIRNLLPGAWLPVVDGVLTVLGIYFRLNPQQTFNKSGEIKQV